MGSDDEERDTEEGGSSIGDGSDTPCGTEASSMPGRIDHSHSIGGSLLPLLVHSNGMATDVNGGEVTSTPWLQPPGALPSLPSLPSLTAHDLGAMASSQSHLMNLSSNKEQYYSLDPSCPENKTNGFPSLPSLQEQMQMQAMQSVLLPSPSLSHPST
ncbi:hypothetical protein PENTCL1PPCAC_11658 [Pristionchus entomophagus]|uniref:Uncharacterized protein n=1 Tax=Pristionchus entomophagus TaxID=358040 RepID=A0AAV5T5N0_9BILA|nr:hypothetical protein PENTCL1PPCAC_11658 [Pristionchus entomophagus]